ncbi:glutathione synthetase [Arcanobacterium wilhelmae]|uniref:ATP-grasp domain-containing protein n=1 Tax=Arcanobacterium wilhelmae TaxID=1803177 RepID=UPI002415294F|nr:glutathione synthetase [Arcanobacterium wilhelmae]WFN89818.1 glutathione synthetase [Arcanobacterium wilhelmae]
MAAPIVTLATAEEFPHLDSDDQNLPDALRERGMEPRIAVWNDPSVNWAEAGTVIVRSTRDYARDPKGFIGWAKSLPRVFNSPWAMEWNLDKHYLKGLQEVGLPTIPTTWLEPEQKLSKQQIHSRFPAWGDFVVKPAVSSGGRGTGRYTATDAKSRAEAILHAQYELERGRTVMVQRYLSEIDHSGETSLIYFNGLASHQVEKAAMLHPRYRSAMDSSIADEVVHAAAPSEKYWHWGERIRQALHSELRKFAGHDELLLFNRVDVVQGGPDSPEDFYVMEISLIDGSLYLGSSDEHLDRFANAIQVRVFDR